MRKLIVGMFVSAAILTSATAHAVDEPGLTSGQMVVLELIMRSIVNMYSSNVIITDSYGNGGIVKEDALAAMAQNREFLKILTGYAMEMKRQNTAEDRKTVEFLAKLTEVCSDVGLQLNAMEDYIEKNDKASIALLNKCRSKLEMSIEELLNSDLSD